MFFSRNTLFRRGLAACVVALLITVILSLALDVRSQLDQLDSAASENVQWTLGQAETEVMSLQIAILRAQNRPGDADALQDVRLNFDIVYSRIDTLQRAKVLADLRGLPTVPPMLGQALDYREEWVPLVDGPDDRLAEALPAFYAETEAIRGALRRFALDGVAFFASAGDLRSAEISRILSSIGAVTVALVGVLLILMLALLRLARQRELEARSNRETRERMETIIATSLDAVVAVGSDDRIVEWNGAAERVFGYTNGEAIGADMADLIVPQQFEQMHRRAMRRFIRTGEARIVGRGIIQLEARRKDGTIFPVDLSLAEAQSPDGAIFVAFIRDISDRVRGEQALKTARDRAIAGEKQKAELLAVMSHEMRTPLNGILGTLDLFHADGLEAENRRYLRIIRQSGELLLAHVNDVLDISRLDADKMSLNTTRFDLVALLEQVVESQTELARAQGNHLVLSPPSPELHHVYSDPDRLRQILLNLVSNAIKFTRDGQVTIEADCSEGLSQVELRVIDSGVGISATDLERIFDDFVTIDSSYSRRHAGTGLGLGISQRLATALGGELGAESEPGDGSVFWLRLPMKPPDDAITLPPVPRKSTQTAPMLPPLDVLLVEDNAINREVAGQMLRRDGHVVVIAQDGASGVALAATQKFDVVLMDISMPGMDGITAARAIRSGGGPNAKTSIVATTAHALPDEVTSFFDAGMNSVLTKPLTTATLRHALAEALSLGAETLSFTGNENSPAAGKSAMSEAGLSIPVPPNSSPPFIDNEHFDELSEDLPKARLQQVLEDFATEIDAFLTDLPEALAADSPPLPSLSEEAHRLAGSAGVFGAMPLAEQLRQCQVDAHHEDIPALRKLSHEMAATWTGTKGTFKQMGFGL
ncbi:response regulator [Sagittula sp. NFXS13]|uniref:hybrid sensor histidine kinase/response regulator n=1 Tax=Sagittula sp. NFXS13 TaxID=2819095 RepID=UPI0032DF07A0